MSLIWDTHLSQGCVTRAEVRIDNDIDTVCKELSGLLSRVLRLQQAAEVENRGFIGNWVADQAGSLGIDQCWAPRSEPSP
jgi:hypothetical protein